LHLFLHFNLFILIYEEVVDSRLQVYHQQQHGLGC